jgi:hypothetical protein
LAILSTTSAATNLCETLHQKVVSGFFIAGFGLFTKFVHAIIA